GSVRATVPRSRRLTAPCRPSGRRDETNGRAASLRVRMAFPFFPPDDDPGPSFAELLRRSGLSPAVPTERLEGVTHGTTVIAIRYADGVVMAGDRRATSGHLISHRTMEKVYPADRHSGV